MDAPSSRGGDWRIRADAGGHGRKAAHELGIVRRSRKRSATLDWTMRLAGNNKNCVVPADHYAIEAEFSAMLEMLHHARPQDANVRIHRPCAALCARSGGSQCVGAALGCHQTRDVDCHQRLPMEQSPTTTWNTLQSFA